MRKRKPETLALAVALTGMMAVLAFFIADLLLSRHRDLSAAERRLQHFGIMMAEHTARSFEAADVVLRETATDLSLGRRGWESWNPGTGWEYIAQRHSRAMPQIRDLIIFDPQGNQRFISTQFPANQINVRDRPYFKALEDGAEVSTFGPYLGRNSARYTYAIARRLSGEGGRFAGVVMAAMEPAYLQDFCWPNRLSDNSETVLTNAEGEIIASCRPADLSRQSPILGAKAAAVLFSGRLAEHIPNTGIAHGNGFLISVWPVPGFSDLRIVTAVPEKSLLAGWYDRFFELGTLAVLVAVVLLVGGLLVRRQVRELASMTAELAAGRDHLEERVREATQELAGQKDAAERANTAKSRFLAAASHDLRQPLHALSLFAADLQRQIRLGAPPGLARLGEQISASTALLGELLDSLLDISRLDVAGIKPEITAFPLQPMFERLAATFRRSAHDRNMKLRFHPTRQWVSTDPVMLEQMIANLVSNALRYTPPGGRVLIGARRRGQQVLIEVRDSGIGIAPEHQASIFAEFYQVGNAAREHNKGLGLGLSIVDRLARALDVDIGLQSRIGDGTNFSLRVALAQPLPAPAANSSPPVGQVHCIGNSEAMRECITLIGRWDYAVTTAAGVDPAALPTGAILIADAELAAAVSAAQPADTALIVLAADPSALHLPPGAHALPLPLRPAKLRALLNQLQKTFSKSTP